MNFLVFDNNLLVYQPTPGSVIQVNEGCRWTVTKKVSVEDAKAQVIAHASLNERDFEASVAPMQFLGMHGYRSLALLGW